MSTPAIDQIIAETHRIVCESHHCQVPPPESVILSLATKLHLANNRIRELDLLAASLGALAKDKDTDRIFFREQSKRLKAGIAESIIKLQETACL